MLQLSRHWASLADVERVEKEEKDRLAQQEVEEPAEKAEVERVEKQAAEDAAKKAEEERLASGVTRTAEDVRLARQEAKEAATEALHNVLRIGMSVRVHGLSARPELNGLEGVLASYDAQRLRWQVELRRGNGTKLFKTDNLEQHVPEADPEDEKLQSIVEVALKQLAPEIEKLRDKHEGSFEHLVATCSEHFDYIEQFVGIENRES